MLHCSHYMCVLAQPLKAGTANNLASLFLRPCLLIIMPTVFAVLLLVIHNTVYSSVCAGFLSGYATVSFYTFV
jgi:hypothetical protein